MVLKRTSVVYAYAMMLMWVLADLADKGAAVFGDQPTPHLDQLFGAYYGVLMVAQLTPTPRLPKLMRKPSRTRVLLVIPLIVALVIFPIVLIRLYTRNPALLQFGVDAAFVPLLLWRMWCMPRHDLELIEMRDQPEQGTTGSLASSSIS